MLTALKLFLHDLLAPTLYLGVWITFLIGIVKRAEWAFYLLILLIPLPVVWYQLHQFPMGKDTMDILVLSALLGILTNKKGFERAPAMWLLGSFMLVSYLALWNATLRFGLDAPFTTSNPLLADWKNYVEMIMLYFIAYSVIRDEDQQKTTIVIIATVFLLIMARESRNFTEGGAFSYDERAAGPFWIVGLGANHFGAFIAAYGGLLLGLFLLDKHKYRKWLYLAGLVSCVQPLFFAYSRGAYLAALAVVVAYGLIQKRTLLAGVAALVITWQTVLPVTVVERISMTETESGQIEASAEHRLALWEHAKQLFQDNMIFGVGFGGFGYTVPSGELTDTHSFYMKTASEQGLIGLAMLAAVILAAFSSGWRLFRRGRSAFHRGLGLGFTGCVVAVMVSNMFGDRWSYFMLGSYFWIAWGLVDRAGVLSSTAADEPQPAVV